jgi:metal-responsive CopG/Arc/MetJ family transcriptional regulator
MSTTTSSGTGKPAGKAAGTEIGLRIPPRLLARLDAIVARRPDPKPTRAKLIKNLVRQALNARDKGVKRPGRGV